MVFLDFVMPVKTGIQCIMCHKLNIWIKCVN